MTFALICHAPSWREFLASNQDGEYHRVPAWIGEELHRFALTGDLGVEDVTLAFLTCDLRGLMSHADDRTLAAIRPIWRLLYNRLPSPCWGSAEKVAAWRELGGWIGHMAGRVAGVHA